MDLRCNIYVVLDLGEMNPTLNMVVVFWVIEHLSRISHAHMC